MADTNLVKFYRGNKPFSGENFDATKLTDEHGIYFFTDTQEIWMDGEFYGASTDQVAALNAAIKKAQDAANDAQKDVDALEVYVGTIPAGTDATDVITYLTQVIATTQDDIDTFKETYATDKAALVAEDARIVGLVEAEAERAAGVEEGLEDRIETMEVFWASAQADGTDSNVIDTLKEIQDYIASDESGAADMLASIQQNAKAISDMDTAYKAADSTLQGNIDALSATVDTKAAASDLTALAGRVTTVESDLNAETTGLKARMGTAEADIDALQALFGGGEGSVSDQIADAVAAEAALRAQGDADTLAAAKTHAEGLNTAMDERMDVVEAKAHEHSNKEELDLIASGDKAKWDAALQQSDIATGASNGTIAVKGTDVAVKGLGSAAYTEITAYDASGAADAAYDRAKNYVDTALTWQSIG